MQFIHNWIVILSLNESDVMKSGTSELSSKNQNSKHPQCIFRQSNYQVCVMEQAATSL